MITDEKTLMSELLKTQAGRIFIGLIITESGFLNCAMRDTTDRTAFAEGERHVGQRAFEMAWAVNENMPMKCMREYGEWLKELDRIRDKERREDINA